MIFKEQFDCNLNNMHRRTMNRNQFRLPRMPSTQHMVPLRSVANKKLLSEAESLSRNPVKGCEAAPRDDDVMIWTAVIEGPTGSLYEGGSFFVQLRFDDDYPFTAPNVIFLTRIYHCNIDNEGRINLPLINTGWSPCKSISDILRAILALMRQCQPEMALEQELGDQCSEEPEKYASIAREWTRRYAH